MIYPKRSVVLYLLLSIIIPFSALAVSDNDPNSPNYEPYQLGEIIVTGSKPVAEKVQTITRVTAAEIQAQGARNLNEALDLVPGLQVRIGGAGTPRIDIRGFRTRHVTLLLDGIPFNSTFDGQFDPTTIPVELIAEIKVISGGGSLLYGPGGNGGIINIITKKGKSGMHGSLLGEIGEEESTIGRGTFSYATDVYDIFVAGSVQDKDGYPLSDDFTETEDEDGGCRENSDLERKNLFASANLFNGEKTQVGVTLNVHEGENGIPPIVNFDENDPFSKKLKYDRIDDLSSIAGQLAFDHRFSSEIGIRGWFYANSQDMEENRYDDSDYDSQKKNGASFSDSTSEIFGANLQFIYEWGSSGKFTVGAMVENQSWEEDGFQNKKDKKTGEIKIEDIHADEDNDRYSFVCEYEWQPIYNVGIGLGYGHHFLEKDAGKDDDAGAYRIGAFWDVHDGTRLKASYAKNVRFPSIRQLFDSKDGNEDLIAEETFHYEIGIIQQLFGNTSLELNAFKTDAEDFIEKIDDNPYENYEDYKFWGIEFVATCRPVDALLLRIGYSYLYSEDDSPNTDRDELQHRPENKFTAEATYRFKWGMTFHADMLHVSNQYYYDADEEPPMEKASLNDYTLVNVKLSQELTKENIKVFIGVDNLFDEDYEQSYGLPQPGLFAYGGLELSF